MTIEFGRDICNNLSQASTREWLVTNGIGGYACGTIADVLTRRYHGLLIAALKPPVDRQLMLAKLDTTVNYGGRRYALSANRWASGIVDPQGYMQLERFHLEGTIPVWTYALGRARLEKRIWMGQGQNRTYIRYSLLQAKNSAQLTLKALINDRNHHHSSHRGMQAWVPSTESIPQGLCWRSTPDATALALRVIDGEAQFKPEQTWHLDYELSQERDRGLDAQEDHFHGATLTAELLPGRSLTLIAEAVATVAQLQALRYPQQAGRIDSQNNPKDVLEQQNDQDAELLTRCLTSPAYHLGSEQFPPAWVGQLMLAANQFVVQRQLGDSSEQGASVIAGYPWFNDWGRDTMISLPGLLAHDPAAARPILQTFARYVDQGMLPNTFPDDSVAPKPGADVEPTIAPQYNTVDATLWYFEAVRWYYAATHDEALIAELFPVLADIIQWHQRGTRHGIHLDADGLLYAGEPNVQLTWMDAKVAGNPNGSPEDQADWVVTPRMGKPVEVNALWYNALLVMWQLAKHLNQPHGQYRELAQNAHRGFQRFWNPEKGYCYDVLDGPHGPSDALRPNQLFALALPLNGRHRASLLSPAQEKAVVDICQSELLTPMGLRSLGPHHPDYQRRHSGTVRQRDGAYHQGTVWGWLIGPFVQAHLKVYQDKVQARTFLAGLEAHLGTGCVGTLGEIFDGNAPHAPKGAFAQAWTVAEVLRAWTLTQ